MTHKPQRQTQIGALVFAVVAAAAANEPPSPEGSSVASRVPSRSAEDGTGLDAHANGKAQQVTRVLGSDAARAVGRFEPGGPRGYRAATAPDAPLRATHAEAVADESAWLDGPHLYYAPKEQQ